MMKVLVFAALLPSMLMAQDRNPAIWSFFLQQRGIYFFSDRFTMAGVGAGIGTQVVWNRSFIAQADVNVLWGNGNAVPIRLAFGYQQDSHWSPAILGTFSLFWGQRTEILSETGRRPIAPVWAVGILVAPLRFDGSIGYASALEMGYGIGPYNGQSLELTILAVGIRW